MEKKDQMNSSDFEQQQNDQQQPSISQQSPSTNAKNISNNSEGMMVGEDEKGEYIKFPFDISLYL